MKIAKRLVAALVLTLFVAISGLAGETPPPPCTPGQIDTPPCAAAQSSILGELQTPPTPRDDASLTEIASSVLFSILSLF